MSMDLAEIQHEIEALPTEQQQTLLDWLASATELTGLYKSSSTSRLEELASLCSIASRRKSARENPR